MHQTAPRTLRGSKIRVNGLASDKSALPDALKRLRLCASEQVDVKSSFSAAVNSHRLDLLRRCIAPVARCTFSTSFPTRSLRRSPCLSCPRSKGRAACLPSTHPHKPPRADLTTRTESQRVK